MFQAVLFDLDDTLFDHQGCARESLAAVQQAHEALRAIPFEALERAHAGFLEDLHGEVMLGRVPLEAARVERFRRLLRAVGAEGGPDVAGEIAAMYRDTYRPEKTGRQGHWRS
jgi:putative hydrolase of the HAD superfamily